MPIYEYECPKCGRFELIQKVSDKPSRCKPDCAEADCPRKARRMVSAAAFHLKGSGWYKTDYSSGSTGGNGKQKSSGVEKTVTSDAGAADSTSTKAAAESTASSKPAAADSSSSSAS